MKQINLRGITESLSDKEMKMVKGGDPLKIQKEPPPLPVEQEVCRDKLPTAKCSLGWSGGVSEGTCLFVIQTGKLTCIPKK